MLGGVFRAPVNVTLDGQYVAANVWLGAESRVGELRNTCADWDDGTSNATGNLTVAQLATVVSMIGSNCSNPQRLMCFEN